MCLGSLLGAGGETAFPANAVGLPGNGFQMGRITAGPISAEMVDFGAFGDFTNEQFIGDTMRIECFTGHADLPVAIGLDVSLPLPAPGWSDFDVPHYPFNRGCHSMILPEQKIIRNWR